MSVMDKDGRILCDIYHTLDPLVAIDQVLEAKKINLPKTDEEKIKQGLKYYLEAELCRAGLKDREILFFL